MEIENLIEQFPFLKDIEYKEFVFPPSIHVSLAATIVNADLPYKPGVYIVYNYSDNKLGALLYVGKSGADKKGNINTHQIPKRLLAVCYPPERYLKGIEKKHITRNEIWPMMMKQDNITAIKVFCFFSPITANFKVQESTIPQKIEDAINEILKDKKINQPWSKRYA
jgi:hypothetical protein